MKKIAILFLFLVIFIISCKPSEQIKEPFCGDDICQENEELSCAEDCGGFQGITKLQCAQAKGSWNDCGSPCAGTGAEFCIAVCSHSANAEVLLDLTAQLVTSADLLEK